MTRTVLRRRAAPAGRPGIALIVGIIGVGLIASCGGSPSSSPNASAASPHGLRVDDCPIERQPDGVPVAASTTSTPAPSAGSVAFDACAILSAADIAKVVGATPTSISTPGGGWSAGDCAWNSDKGSFLLSIGTADSIRAFGDPAVPDAKARLAQYRQESSAAGSPRDIKDIGDGAVLTTNGMAAYKADTYVEVLNLGMTEKQLIEIMKLAIKKA